MGNPNWTKGVSGNPTGRHTKVPGWIRRFREGEPVAMSFVLKLVSGKIRNATIAERLRAVELLLSYSRGKPRQQIDLDLSDDDGNPVTLNLSLDIDAKKLLSDPDTRALLQRAALRSAREGGDAGSVRD